MSYECDWLKGRYCCTQLCKLRDTSAARARRFILFSVPREGYVSGQWLPWVLPGPTERFYKGSLASVAQWTGRRKAYAPNATPHHIILRKTKMTPELRDREFRRSSTLRYIAQRNPTHPPTESRGTSRQNDSTINRRNWNVRVKSQSWQARNYTNIGGHLRFNHVVYETRRLLSSYFLVVQLLYTDQI